MRHTLLLVLVLCTGLFIGCGSEGDSNPDQDSDVAADTDTASDVGNDGTDTSPDITPDVPVDNGPDIDPGPRELLNGTAVRFGHVVDGDTLDVFVGDPPLTYIVRLKGLSAPECNKSSITTEFFGRRNQCVSDDEFYGLQSRTELVDILAPNEGILTCDDVAVGQWCPTDNFDRYLAYIEVNGRDVATEMAYRGAGFSYTSFFSSKRADICAAEYDAIAMQRGMWANGTMNAVLSLMSQQTQSWYGNHHDQRCDEALGQ